MRSLRQRMDEGFGSVNETTQSPEVKAFIKDIKDSDGHIGDVVKASGGEATIVHYREYGSQPTAWKTKRIEESLYESKISEKDVKVGTIFKTSNNTFEVTEIQPKSYSGIVKDLKGRVITDNGVLFKSHLTNPHYSKSLEIVNEKLRNKKFKFRITKGKDHFKGVDLYRVDGVDNEYVGEWTTDKKVAEKEMKDL